MGHIEKNLLAQAKRFGNPLPDRIVNKPIMALGLDVYMNAFNSLQFDREWLMSPNGKTIAMPLRWGVIAKYCEHYGITGIDFENMVYIIDEMDTVFTIHSRKKAQQS